MKIDDLKSQAEDVEAIPVEQEEPQLTPEQIEMQEKFFRSAILRKYKLALNNLYQVMKRHRVSIADIKQLIIDKTKWLPFTASQRAFILGFKDEFLVQLLKDMYNEKELHEINLTISEDVLPGAGDTRDVQSNG